MDDKTTTLKNAIELLNHKCWAALATIDKNGKPHASMLAYAVASDSLYFHLSALAQHTRILKNNPFCSIVISEDEILTDDPQTLARLSMDGRVVFLEKDSEIYPDAAAIYQQRLPESSALFEFSDFSLIKFIPEKSRYIGGFGKAFSFSGSDLIETGLRLNY
jgi:hypothetical protein